MDIASRFDQENKRRRSAPLLLIAVTLALGVSAGRAQDPSPAAGSAPAPRQAQTGILPGVKNFGQVTPRLFRGAQPTTEGFDQLQKLGIGIVVDFRQEKGEIAGEGKAVEARQMRFVSIPWNALDNPSPDQVREYFALLRANPDKKIFVHCREGADRTGTMVAIYRIAAQQWTPDDALREMKAYHLHFWLPHLKDYVKKFPQQLESDAALRSAIPAPPTSP